MRLSHLFLLKHALLQRDRLPNAFPFQKPGVDSKVFLCGERVQESARWEWKHKRAPVFEKDAEVGLSTSTRYN